MQNEDSGMLNVDSGMQNEDSRMLNLDSGMRNDDSSYSFAGAVGDFALLPTKMAMAITESSSQIDPVTEIEVISSDEWTKLTATLANDESAMSAHSPIQSTTLVILP